MTDKIAYTQDCVVSSESISYISTGFFKRNITYVGYRLLDSLVVECWHRVREVRYRAPVVVLTQ